MSKKKKQNRFYCIECLRKFRVKGLRDGTHCPFCNVPARCNTTKRVAQIVTRLLRQRGLLPAKAKNDYELYLMSDTWKTIRQRVLERDKHECQACGGKAEIVHHKSYDRDVLDGLRDDELVSLCNPCHRKIEFTEDNGRPVKNGLSKANGKLHHLIKARGKQSLSPDSFQEIFGDILAT